jgi:hypothetical protein
MQVLGSAGVSRLSKGTATMTSETNKRVTRSFTEFVKNSGVPCLVQSGSS